MSKQKATMIRNSDGLHVHGHITSEITQLLDGTKHWRFKTEKGEVWDCMDDYWFLKLHDTRQVDNAMQYFKEEKESKFFDTLRKIFTFGVAK